MKLFLITSLITLMGKKTFQGSFSQEIIVQEITQRVLKSSLLYSKNL